jgi:hypothetical protein
MELLGRELGLVLGGFRQCRSESQETMPWSAGRLLSIDMLTRPQWYDRCAYRLCHPNVVPSRARNPSGSCSAIPCWQASSQTSLCRTPTLGMGFGGGREAPNNTPSQSPCCNEPKLARRGDSRTRPDRPDLRLRASFARPNHVGAAIARYKRAGRIEERDGTLYATRATETVQRTAV